MKKWPFYVSKTTQISVIFPPKVESTDGQSIQSYLLQKNKTYFRYYKIGEIDDELLGISKPTLL